MNSTAIESSTSSRVRTELIIGSLWLAVGLFVVPALIYWVGTSALGPYGDKATLSDFYGAFFADLASGAPRAWLIALGPLLLISLVRVLYIGVGAKAPVDKASDDDEPSAKPVRNVAPVRKRVEPRVG